MAENYVGQILMFAGTFAIQGTAFCNGATVSISQNEALFSLLGTNYGGNGTTTFQLPNLQGRVPIGMGQSAGTSNYLAGQLGGTETTSILISNLPSHTHTVTPPASASNGSATSPAGAYPATILAGSTHAAAPAEGYASSSDGTTTAAFSSGATGGSVPINILQPYLAITYLIVEEGEFPARN